MSLLLCTPMSLLLCIIFVSISSIAYGDFITVEGQLKCCNPPFKDVAQNKTIVNCAPINDGLIELWDQDNPSKGDDDDLLVETLPSEIGRFTIRGAQVKNGPVDFYIKVFHQCGLRADELKKRCYRVSTKNVPREFNSKNDSWKLFPWQISTTNEEKDLIICP
uniref:Uncharacterized protein n=1 Tax=Acrobeloides nanus TaxID=290746 RepID=A0A914EB72_9BILA